MKAAATISRVRARAGAAAFLIGSVLVHGGNYVFNLAAVRFLSPAEYADVALTVTLLLFAGFVTVGFQMAVARTVAEHDGQAEPQGIAAWFGRRAVRLGIAVGAAIAVGSPVLAATFRTASPLPFLAVGLSLPFAFATGVGRGLAQGLQRFGRLAISFQVEMLVRLGAGAGFMAVGFGVAGAVGGVAASLVAAAFVVRSRAASPAAPGSAERRRLMGALWPAMALLVGEALVNHGDTIIVKQAFEPAAAGQFAAIALLGRSVFFATWPISMLVYPIASRRAAAGASTRSLLLAAVGAVAMIGTVAVVVASAYAVPIVELVLGADYVELAHLLAPYVAATALFSCAATIVAFGVAVGSSSAGFAGAAAGVGCLLVLGLFHPSLAAVVWIQVALMAGYLAGAALWVIRRERTAP